MTETTTPPTALPAPPGATVEIVLWDGPSLIPYWEPPEDNEWPELVRYTTVGYVLHDSAKMLMLGQTDAQGVQQGTFQGVQQIPKACVVARRHLFPPLT